jgi:hypothetical protein
MYENTVVVLLLSKWLAFCIDHGPYLDVSNINDATAILVHFPELPTGDAASILLSEPGGSQGYL